MQFPGQFPILAIGADETRQGHRAAVREQQGDFGDAPDVLVAVGLAEAEVAIEPEADVVAIEPVGGQGGVQEVLLECGGDGGFPRGGEPGEPDCKAGLGAQGAAFAVG